MFNSLKKMRKRESRRNRAKRIRKILKNIWKKCISIRKRKRSSKRTEQSQL